MKLIPFKNYPGRSGLRAIRLAVSLPSAGTKGPTDAPGVRACAAFRRKLRPLLISLLIVPLGAGAWGHCLLDSNCRPANELGVRPGEYVLPKTAQDAFTSSNLAFLLTNLNVRHIVFIEGHTEACLGRTASSARQRGFRTLCVEDATFNARESTRQKGIEQAQYDYVLTTAQFLNLAKEAAEPVAPKRLPEHDRASP